jgi:hypothetical protein
MSGLMQLNSAERCVERIFADRTPGDFMECGVCQGGFSIFLRGLQVAYGEGGRKLWLADTFKGAPAPQSELDRKDGLDFQEPLAPWFAFGVETVQDHFRRYDLASTEVKFLVGPLHETVPGNEDIGRLALLRLDTDFYTSILLGLEQLYDRVSPGGFVLVDDYGHIPGVRDAVHDFRERRGITAPLQRADQLSVFWRKTA